MNWTGSLSLPMTIVIVIAILIIAWIIYVKLEERKSTLWKCAWCGNEFITFVFRVKSSIKYRTKLYCSGRCQRADEASSGVKEKRIRWIDHE